MLPRSTDRLMLTFCRTGDPRALGRVFDRTAQELLRVALYLAGSRPDAEDLLQRTFLAAIESRATYDPTRRALPWLLGILTNHARRLQRERKREQSRDSASRPDGTGGNPETLASEREMAERVARLRTELGAPYAEVLELHLEQGCNCREIARRLGRPEGTVRTQLMRGRELLRKRLSSRYLAAVVPLLPDVTATAAIKAHVLASAAHLEVVAGATASTTTFATGGLMMSKKLLFAVPATLLLLGASVYSGWFSGETKTPAPPTTVEASGTMTDETQGESVDAASEGLASVRQPAAPPADPDPGFGMLRVEARWQDGHPAANIGVGAEGLGIARNERRNGITGADGTCMLPHLRVGSWRVTATHADNNVTVDVRGGTPNRCSVTVTAAITARGRVVDDHEQPVADAEVWIASKGDAHWRRFAVARSDAQGRFELPLSRAVYVGAQKAGFASSYAVAIDPAEEPSAIVLALRGAGCRIVGTVRDARGEPIAWARVHVGTTFAMTRSFNGAYERQLFAAAGPETLTDGNGQYILRGLMPGKEFVQAWAPGTAQAQEVVEVATTVTACDFTLTGGAVVHGQVRTGSGVPVPGAHVGLSWEQGQFIDSSVEADDEGRFRIAGLAAGPQSLTAKAKARRATSSFDLAVGSTVEWNPELQLATEIRGQVLSANGRPLAGVVVSISDGSGLTAGAMANADSDGAFVLQPPASGPLDVRVGELSEPALKTVYDVRPGADIVIQLTIADMPNALLHGRVVDDSRRPLLAQIMATKHRASLGHSDETGADGRFRVGPQSAGRYVVRITSKTHGTVSMPTLQLQPDEQRDLGDIVMQAPGSATVTVRDEGGRPTRGFVALYTEQGGWVASIRTDDGRAHFPTLQPARYLVTCGGSPYAAGATLDVLPAAEAFADLNLARVGYADVLVEDASTAEECDVRAFVFAGDQFAGMFGNMRGARRVRLWVPPGRYTVELRSVDGRTVRTELAIADTDDHPRVKAVLPAR